jgi:hypothetical protein
MFVGTDQACPLYISSFPTLSAATQKVELEHDTDGMM